MAQDSLQCLAQLASMHGPIFPDESAQVTYLAHLVEGLLNMINGCVSLKPSVMYCTHMLVIHKYVILYLDNCIVVVSNKIGPNENMSRSHFTPQSLQLVK